MACDERIPLELRDELVCACQGVCRSLGVRHRELDDRLAEHPAKAGAARLAGDLLFEVVHVRERRRPRFDHLEHGEPCARTHELG